MFESIRDEDVAQSTTRRWRIVNWTGVDAAMTSCRDERETK